jgi:hypothetical protein
VDFATPSAVAKGKLKLNFKKPSRDSLKLSGTYQSAFPPGLEDGLTGTFTAGAYVKAFSIGAKGKSAKDPNIKVKIIAKKAKWSVVVKKTDLAAALGIADADVPKPGVPQNIIWSLTLSNGWRISGTTILTYTAKQAKRGKGKL